MPISHRQEMRGTVCKTLPNKMFRVFCKNQLNPTHNLKQLVQRIQLLTVFE